MVQLASPAPYASVTPGLAFGNTTVKPYSRSRPHQGKDWKWSAANPTKSKQTHAPAAGIVKVAYNDGKWHNGWGNYVDIHITTEAFVRLAHHETGSVRVTVGQKVALGDRVGTMGDTGEVAKDHDHLHEELWLKQRDGSWKRVNPDLYRGPNGRHLPGTPLVSEPKPAPAGGNSKPATPAAPTQEEDDMTVYAKAKGAKDVYEIKDGRKRLLGPAEWTAIKTALAAAGRKVPYSNGKLTVAQINSIPTVK